MVVVFTGAVAVVAIIAAARMYGVTSGTIKDRELRYHATWISNVVREIQMMNNQPKIEWIMDHFMGIYIPPTHKEHINKYGMSRWKKQKKTYPIDQRQLVLM